MHVAGAVRRPGLIRVPARPRVATRWSARAGSPRGRPHRREPGGEGAGRPAGGGAATGRGRRRGGGGGRGRAPLRRPGRAGSTSRRATVEQLDQLDGIGPTLAKRIVEYRDAHGGFGSLDELSRWTASARSASRRCARPAAVSPERRAGSPPLAPSPGALAAAAGASRGPGARASRPRRSCWPRGARRSGWSRRSAASAAIAPTGGCRGAGCSSGATSGRRGSARSSARRAGPRPARSTATRSHLLTPAGPVRRVREVAWRRDSCAAAAARATRAGRGSRRAPRSATSSARRARCGRSGPDRARGPASTSGATCAAAASPASCCSTARGPPGGGAAVSPGRSTRARGAPSAAVGGRPARAGSRAAARHGARAGRGIAAATREDCRASGLAHLLAVSGQNVMLLVALALPLRRSRARAARARLCFSAWSRCTCRSRGRGRRCSARASWARAGVAALALSRPASRWYALLLAAAATLALNPRVSADPGWQLSFAAVAGILLGPQLAAALVPPARGSPGRGRPADGRPGAARGRSRGLADGAALTLAATLATAPLWPSTSAPAARRAAGQSARAARRGAGDVARHGQGGPRASLGGAARRPARAGRLLGSSPAAARLPRTASRSAAPRCPGGRSSCRSTRRRPSPCATWSLARRCARARRSARSGSAAPRPDLERAAAGARARSPRRRPLVARARGRSRSRCSGARPAGTARRT